MGKDVEAERERQREEEEQRRRMADPLLAALPEGLQKRQQVGGGRRARAVVWQGGGLGRRCMCTAGLMRQAKSCLSGGFSDLPSEDQHQPPALPMACCETGAGAGGLSWTQPPHLGCCSDLPRDDLLSVGLNHPTSPPCVPLQDTELGPSWVAGMTEVPLSLEQKLKNIEETEAAKKRMLAIVPGALP